MELKVEFYQIAQRSGRSISSILRELVRKYVEQEKLKEPKVPRKIKVY